MKNSIHLIVFLITIWVFPFRLYAQSEPFSMQVLNTMPPGTSQDYALAHPFELTYGPDDFLYVSEKIGRVLRVNTTTGIRSIILDIQSKVYLTINRSGSAPFAASSIGQDGMMGLALHPQFGQGTNQDSIFVAYSYADGQVRISRFSYNGFNSADGLVAEYFNNRTLSNEPVLNRTDTDIDFVWAGSPGAGIGTDNFSVRWTGQVQAPVTGNYTFSTNSDDGVRLYVNDTLRINNWTDHGATIDNSGSVFLNAGQLYNIKMEFYESTAGATAQLLWAYPGQAQQVIPAARFFRSGNFMTGEKYLIEGLPANNDHSSGRLTVGADNRLYYSCGDLGHNQFGSTCLFILSQDLPSAAHVSAENYMNYSGKVLRIGFDGSIPSDNPLLSGVRSHVFTLGHRNPQGLVWQRNASLGYGFPTMTAGGKLFSSEQGPRTDDEINILESGRNYGWPYIAGDSDNINYQYVVEASSGSCNAGSYNENYIAAGAQIFQENQAPASVKTNFRAPLKMLFKDCGSLPFSKCDAGGTNWMKFATIAPSSVDFYGVNGGPGIPDWYPSLIVPTLRKGTLYRLKLNPAQTAFITDTIPYFFSNNRYRDVAINPAGNKIYIITDSIGTTSGPSGSGTSSLTNRGAILEYTYTGAGLAVSPRDTLPQAAPAMIKIYPNPATDFVTVSIEKSVRMPVRYQLFDGAGRLVADGSSSKDRFVIRVSGMRAGVYVLKIFNVYGAEIKMEKIIKM
ncbi:MAG: PQQ-dependent sugar dehydrogenase [Gemmatimonadaceae bacterium]|nr:PQQ-dependent sugar dehydrogenase [Chitinophagaceae bacterium]